jgi:hypothetical protein
VGRSSVGYRGWHRDGTPGLRDRTEHVLAPSDRARLDPRPRIPPRRAGHGCCLSRLVATVDEGSSLVGIWPVHPHQRGTLCDLAVLLLRRFSHSRTGGVLPLPGRDAGVDRGHRDQAAFHRNGRAIRSSRAGGMSDVDRHKEFRQRLNRQIEWDQRRTQGFVFFWPWRGRARGGLSSGSRSLPAASGHELVEETVSFDR